MGEDALKVIGVLVLVMLSSACGAREPLGVRETIKNIHALNGKTVRVTGYLGQCGGYDCGLFETKQDYDRLSRIMREARSGGRANLDRMPDWLGISSGELDCPNPSAREGCHFSVDQQAAPFQNSYVVITGKISDLCRDEQLRMGCTDRAPELTPIDFAKWTPPAENVS